MFRLIMLCAGSFIFGAGFMAFCVDVQDGRFPILPLIIGILGISIILISAGLLRISN